MFSDDPVAAFLEEAYEAIFQNVLDVERVFVAVLVHESGECAIAWPVCAEGGKFKIRVMGMFIGSTHVDRDALLSNVFVPGV